jgi:hypothetical protein
MRIAVSVIAILAIVLQPSSARAATAWPVDDTCTLSHSGSYFYLGGPLSGFGIHSGGYNNCHITNNTTTSGTPVHWAHYLLPVNNPAYAGSYRVYSWVNCEHNAPKYKYYLYFNGTNGGNPNEIYTTSSHVTCGGAFQRVPSRTYGTLGASIRLVDNVGTWPEWQQLDYHLFNP